MIKNLWSMFLKLFGKKDIPKETQKNDNYVTSYEEIKDINITAMISNKMAKYTNFESVLEVEGNNKRAEELNRILKLVWNDKNKIISRAYGTGGVFLYPYLDNNVLKYSLITQNRVSINQVDNGKITDATVVLDIYKTNSSIYYLLSDIQIVDNTVKFTQKVTMNGSVVEKTSVSKWSNIEDETIIKNVDRILMGYIKSPIDNRQDISEYGVPITYGCEATIVEIRELLQKIALEFDVKDAFIGVDYTLFNQDANGKVSLPSGNMWKKLNSGKDDFFEVFSPEIRETSYYTRLKELYLQLEKQIGLSQGVLSEMPSFTTATQFKKALFDTLQTVGQMQDNIENGIRDFIYSCDVLLNRASVIPMGDYEINFEWSYLIAEDYQQIFTNDITMMDKGLKSKAEVRAYQTGETLEEAQEKIEEIKASEPSVADLLGNSNE